MCHEQATMQGIAAVTKAIRIGALLLVTLLVTTKAGAQQLFFPWTTATTTQTSGTITAGGSFQTALAANTSRKGCIVQNQSSHVMSVYLGTLANATTTLSYQLTALGGNRDTFYCNQGPVIPTDNVNVETGTTNDAFVVLAW